MQGPIPGRRASPGAQAMNPRLEAVTGPLTGAIIPIARDRVSIGSDPSNELSIYDASIARNHCLLTRREEAIVVTDLDSPQGTFVNRSEERRVGKECRS